MYTLVNQIIISFNLSPFSNFSYLQSWIQIKSRNVFFWDGGLWLLAQKALCMLSFLSYKDYLCLIVSIKEPFMVLSIH